MQRGDGHGLDGQQTRVVCDGADDDEGFLGLGEALQAGEGEGGAVDAGGEEAAEDDGVEGGGGAACAVSVVLVVCVDGKTKDKEQVGCGLELEEGKFVDVRAKKR